MKKNKYKKIAYNHFIVFVSLKKLFGSLKAALKRELLRQMH